MTKAEIISELEGLEIAFDATLNKTELEKILNAEYAKINKKNSKKNAPPQYIATAFELPNSVSEKKLKNFADSLKETAGVNVDFTSVANK